MPLCIFFFYKGIICHRFVFSVASSACFLFFVILDYLDGFTAVLTNRKSKVGRLLESTDELTNSPTGIIGFIAIYTVFQNYQNFYVVAMWFFIGFVLLIIKNCDIYYRRLVEDGIIDFSNSYETEKNQKRIHIFCFSDIMIYSSHYVLITCMLSYNYLRIRYGLNIFTVYFIYFIGFYSCSALYRFSRNLKLAREADKRDRGYVFWITGLSATGKTTLCKYLGNYIKKNDPSLTVRLAILDGDQIRGSINNDLSYSIQDRNRNVIRTGKIAKILKNEGKIVVVASLSPTYSARNHVKNIIRDNFYLIYLKASLSVLQKRDVKGLYKKNKNVVGIDIKYEEPEAPDLVIDTEVENAEKAGKKLYEFIKTKLI